MSAWDGGDRFSLLVLEEGEYYFRDYNAIYWPDINRLVGYLKVCSASLYFVPKDVNEAIFRIPYRFVASITRLDGEKSPSGEELFLVKATERIDIQKGNKSMPYVREQGHFEFRFSLVYAGLSDVLPMIQQLHYIAKIDQGENGHDASMALLAKVIKAHEDNETFNVGWLEDENEKILLERPGSNVTPLCSQPGRIVITYCRLYFQPFNVVSNKPIHTYSLSKVSSVTKRTYQLEEVGVEVFFGHPKDSLYLAFNSVAHRDEFLKTLLAQPELKLGAERSLATVTMKWVKGKVSNFDYLMFLNREAGRSFKDLTQYPIFPWVIRDYESDSLDLNDKTIYRDLSKPIGALNPKRLVEFKERYRELKLMNEKSGVTMTGQEAPWELNFPPFLYGCHYSTPGYAVYFLLRSEPQLMLKLQNGRFDAPDRLFWSILDTWNSVMTLPTDVKELIPEFYSNDASFLINTESINFGVRSEGVAVNDVTLPPWACGPQDFLQRLAEALESEYVSSKLHKWINLVFGYKSQMPLAEAADNVFHYLTYDDIAIEHLKREKDPVMREALKVQMMEFGRTPKQLFKKRHPKRKVKFTNQHKFGCIGIPNQSRKPRPSNALSFSVATLRSTTSGTSRAVQKLTSSKILMREASLSWLENTATHRDPVFLQLQRPDEIIPLLQTVEVLPMDDKMWDTFARAMRVLCIPETNRQLLINAGALEEIAKAVSCPEEQVTTNALDALVHLTHNIDARWSVSEAAVDTLLSVVSSQRMQQSNRVTALHVMQNLSSCPTNRSYLGSSGGLPALVSLLDDQHNGELRAAAAATLAAVLTDDSHKEQVIEYNALPALLKMCEEPSVELRALAAQCLAALSTQDATRREMMDEHVLTVLSALLCSDHIALKQHAAAVVGNLTSDPSLFNGGYNMDGTVLHSIITAAYSDDPEVQRHAARAFWHLVVQDSSRPRFIESGGLPALTRLMQNASRRVQAKTLAKQALRFLVENNPAIKERLEEMVPGIVHRISHSRFKSISSQYSVSSQSVLSTEQDETSVTPCHHAGSWTPGPSALSQSSNHARSRSSPEDVPQASATEPASDSPSNHQRCVTMPVLGQHFLPDDSSTSNHATPAHDTIQRSPTQAGLHTPQNKSTNGTPQNKSTNGTAAATPRTEPAAATGSDQKVSGAADNSTAGAAVLMPRFSKGQQQGGDEELQGKQDAAPIGSQPSSRANLDEDSSANASAASAGAQSGAGGRLNGSFHKFYSAKSSTNGESQERVQQSQASSTSDVHSPNVKWYTPPGTPLKTSPDSSIADSFKKSQANHSAMANLKQANAALRGEHSHRLGYLQSHPKSPNQGRVSVKALQQQFLTMSSKNVSFPRKVAGNSEGSSSQQSEGGSPSTTVRAKGTTASGSGV